jgi:hypothetical protein
VLKISLELLATSLLFIQLEVAAQIFPANNIYHSYAIKLAHVKKVTCRETEEQNWKQILAPLLIVKQWIL